MYIPLFEIYWDEEDIKAVEEVIRSGMSWACGYQVEELEERIAEFLGVKYCLLFNSGGTALHSLMKAYGFGPGDEVIVPSFTFIATVYAPMYVDAEPVFADIEEDTFGLDPEDVIKRITPKTKALMPIHYGGMPCKIDRLKKIADENDLILIEDAAESFGAKFEDRLVGSFGDSAIFSFCHNKIFTTGEGGCVVTDDESLYEKMKMVRSYGRVMDGDYFTNPKNLKYNSVGYNYRMSTLQAALGLSQLEKVDTSIKLRRKNAEYLHEGLRDIDEIKVPLPPEEKYHPVYQMYTIRVLDSKKKREELMEFLESEGIITRVYFEPVHEYTIFKEVLKDDICLPKTDVLSDQVVTLPLYPGMSKKELDYIIDKTKEFFENRGGENDEKR